jgi:hypothetical protein
VRCERGMEEEICEADKVGPHVIELCSILISS